MILEDSVLASLASKPLLAAEFPFLLAAKKLSGCGCRGETVDTNNLKASVAGLSPEARLRFKELAGVDKVHVVYRSGGKIATVDF